MDMNYMEISKTIETDNLAWNKTEMIGKSNFTILDLNISNESAINNRRIIFKFGTGIYV